jgi:hypothetical protein
VSAAAWEVPEISAGLMVGVPWGAQALASKTSTTLMTNVFRFIYGFTFIGFGYRFLYLITTLSL